MMRRYDWRTFLRKWRRKIMLVGVMIQKGFSWKTVVLCDIMLDMMPKSTRFMHPYGICISGNVWMGERCDVRQGVTIGTRNPGAQEGVKLIGNDVFFGCNCTVLGDVTIGDRAVIGAHSLILKDVPADTTVVGVWR